MTTLAQVAWVNPSQDLFQQSLNTCNKKADRRVLGRSVVFDDAPHDFVDLPLSQKLKTDICVCCMEMGELQSWMPTESKDLDLVSDHAIEAYIMET